MAARVVIADVTAILDNTSLTDGVIEAYITSANVMVTELLGGQNLGADILKEIERWLTAHMIVSTRERQAEREEAGPANVKYVGKFGMSLDSTSYGQMVKSLDPTGIMAASDLKQAEFTVIN